MRCVCRGNDPKKSTCVLLTRSLTHLEDGCGFPNPPLILTLPVTDWIKKNLTLSAWFHSSHHGFNIFTQLLLKSKDSALKRLEIRLCTECWFTRRSTRTTAYETHGVR